MGASQNPTFDQLQIFLAVADTGSFTAAGEQLGRAVSVISYGVAGLEARLELMLFERKGARDAKLTYHGHALLAEARAIVGDVSRLRVKAKGFLEKLEPQVTMVVDALLPPPKLAAVLRAFAQTYPTVGLSLKVEPRSGPSTMVTERTASVGICGLPGKVLEAIEKVAAGSVLLVPVAERHHPLSQTTNRLRGGDNNHTQLVLVERAHTNGPKTSLRLRRTLPVVDPHMMLALIKEGIGWGKMPLWLVENDLASGKLVRLRPPDYFDETYRFFGIWRSDSPPGPAASWLIAQFVDP